MGDVRSEVCNEISQHLRLESSALLESDVIFTEFDGPLGESARELWLVQYALQWISSEDRDRVALEVWS